MCRFVPYIRTANGQIERISYAIYNSPDDIVEPYVYEEFLVGWPEAKVYWANETGPSTGIAPVT